MNPIRIGGFFWILVFFLIQNILGFIFPGFPFPFMLSCVIFYAVAFGPGMGLAAGLWAGLLLEGFASGRFGGQMAFWAAAGFFPGTLSSKIFPDSAAVRHFVPPVVQAALLTAQQPQMSLWAGGFFWGSVLMAAVTTPFVFSWLAPFHRGRR